MSKVIDLQAERQRRKCAQCKLSVHLKPDCCETYCFNCERAKEECVCEPLPELDVFAEGPWTYVDELID